MAILDPVRFPLPFLPVLSLIGAVSWIHCLPNLFLLMNTRGGSQLDYKILHSTGKRVYKVGGETLLKMEAKLNELKIVGDINHALGMYDFKDEVNEDEIMDGVGVMTELGKQFRHIHIELKDEMGDNYEGQYPEYEKTNELVLAFLREAKSKLRVLKEEKYKNGLRVEEEVLILKIRELDRGKISASEDLQDLDDRITKTEALLSDSFNLSARLKKGFGKEFDELYARKVDRWAHDIHSRLNEAKNLKKQILYKMGESQKSVTESTELHRQIGNAENLAHEISLRCHSLILKYDVNFEELSDYQILEISKNKNLDGEFNEILEKITNLVSLSPYGGEEVQKMVKDTLKKRDDLAEKRDKFVLNLQTIIRKRDVSDGKLKNALNLKIELPKFSGYESKMDFYTFKTQFRKLIEPIVQKKYWADYLKRNYLSGSALTLVEKESEYDKIWARLAGSYGNPRLLLQNKLSDLEKMGGLWKIRGDEKIGNAIAGLINAMTDLSLLAAEHKIEGQLYEGGGLEKIMVIMGEHRHRKFRSQDLGTMMSKKDEWAKLLEFLKEELLLREKLALDNKTAKLMGIGLSKNDYQKDGYKGEKSKNWSSSGHTVTSEDLKCHICEQYGHTIITTARGNKIVPYYVCEDFVNMSPEERLSRLNSKNLCIGCLYPGAKRESKHKCFFTNYCCPHPAHDNDKLHILLCEKHKKENATVKLLEKFKDKFIKNCKVKLPNFSRNLSCFNEIVGVREVLSGEAVNYHNESDVTENAIFQLQTIEVDGVRLNLFFDSGCGDMVIRKSAIERLSAVGRAKQIVSGPLTITGVGDQKSICKDGVYSIRLTLDDGSDALLSGLCLPKITAKFPLYDLGIVETYIHEECRKLGGQELLNQLPKLPAVVGGETDILLGIRYAKYFPNKIYKFDTGLGIYESVFRSPCGAKGVVGGPHKEFSKIEKNLKGLHVHKTVYFSPAVCDYRELWGVQNEMPLLGVELQPELTDMDLPSGFERFGFEPGGDAEGICVCAAKKAPKGVKRFDDMESAGTEVTYRCVDCRSCVKCKNGLRIEAISIQEEMEQALIERCVTVDVSRGVTTAKLPFVLEPDTRLAPNEQMALKVYKGQVRKLSDKAADRLAVIESEKKLQTLGFVDFFDNLNECDKEVILSSKVRYFLPWRAVWNEKSLSTPCRLTFDGTQGTREACGINSLLAKGANCMNRLVEILIRWTTRKYAFHSDIQKMYNAVRLDKTHWRFQMYLWDDELMMERVPRWKVIKTLIYGVRPSGNLAECGIRRTAELCKNEFPKAYEVILNDMYVDDCLSGANTLKERLEVTDEVQVTLGKGGFSLKGFTFSGQDPPENVSSDQESVVVGGLKWFPKGDFLKLNIGELNFNKKVRGRKVLGESGMIPDVYTKRDCISRVSEVFDPIGRVAPLLGGLKLDICELHKNNLDWDDPIPNELKNVWAENFDLIQEMGNIKFHRAIVPLDAVNLDVETIDTADAGENLVCAAIYARFKRRNGEYSSQLIFARTKVVHGITIPRAELVAALLNASTGHIVRRSLGDWHKRCWKVTDSQVVLHWINSTKSSLKLWVRNRVIEITRLVDRSVWWYVDRERMIADLGTRKGAKIVDVTPDSPWIQGLPWMRYKEANFPLKTADEIILSNQERMEVNKEGVLIGGEEHRENPCLTMKYVPEEVGDRYKFSKYLINPTRYRFRTVTRILGLVIFFLQKLCQKCSKRLRNITLKNQYLGRSCKLSCNKGEYIVSSITFNSYPTEEKRVVVVHLSDDLLNSARRYFFLKATAEIKQFVDPSKFEKKSVLKDGILYHTGRILSTQEINGQIGLGDVALDLQDSTFVVPMTDENSPIAYAIVSETHWYNQDVKHGGIESVLRYSQQMAFIIGGRNLVKKIKKECVKCRIIHKKGVRAAMGPVGNNNLKVAPAFYYCQVDICGPFSAYSPVNKRASLKVWFVVFCCTVTGAVDCRVMENYTADSFVLAFSRFACRYGYPKVVMPDEGSQLVKGCQDLIISFSDIRHKISVEYGVEFKTCPVGAHYVHGKVERKIQEIKRSITKTIRNNRLSVLQWETLGQQIANSINNMPICLGNKIELLENLDILTPNRLILGRNNNRNPTAPLEISNDFRRIIEGNNDIFTVWFREWLISFVPKLIEKPKWFVSEQNIGIGDVVLFLKSEQEFDRQYQYGIITKTVISRDGVVRVVEIEYQNHGENVKRTTKRGVRDLVIIHTIDEIGISRELHDLANKADFEV